MNFDQGCWFDVVLVGVELIIGWLKEIDPNECAERTNVQVKTVGPQTISNFSRKSQ